MKLRLLLPKKPNMTIIILFRRVEGVGCLAVEKWDLGKHLLYMPNKMDLEKLFWEGKKKHNWINMVFAGRAQDEEGYEG